MTRVLFILKRHGYGRSFGLANSCEFVARALRHEGVAAHVVEVTDNNCIDREVHRYQPTHVIIEAIWVVPGKFRQLMHLHPRVNWTVRIHSNMPFLSMEGVAIDWLRHYANLPGRMRIAANSEKIIGDLRQSIGLPLEHLPNIYAPVFVDEDCPSRVKPRQCRDVDIGCFGAIRPLKNHLQQAAGAMIYANENGLALKFHINATRVEQRAESVAKNLEALFKHTPHTLVKHPWLSHAEFVELVKEMDCGMQVSFSETFNIVAADFVNSEVPFVGSAEIPWLSSGSIAAPTDGPGMAKHIHRVIRSKHIVRKNKSLLLRDSQKALTTWLEYLDTGCGCK
jgi:hypothetical protein